MKCEICKRKEKMVDIEDDIIECCEHLVLALLDYKIGRLIRRNGK